MRQSQSHVEEFAPAGLESRDGVECIEVNGAIAGEAGVWAEEIVVGDEQDGEGEGAVEGVEAASGASVEAIGAVEAFDELFEGAPLFGEVVEVFESEDLVESEGGREAAFGAVGVEEVNAGGIGAEASA